MAMWFDKVVQGLSGKQIINDSKTPSGKVHVGSLRGVLVHDAVYRVLLAQADAQATYLYGIDDYDPLDGLPDDASPELQALMGVPLCNIPAPENSTASDLADHYISEFLHIFTELGVNAETYRMRDVYRSGKFNEAIDVILNKADVVRSVYQQVSNSQRPANWHPFQVICEQCGKIGTSQVSAYDGKEVTYRCRKDLVSWATGCGYRGKISPFDGNGKLPWKLEWVAKWHTLGITIEGAGKDHCTKGGSRDVAVRCLGAIFGDKPPLNVPYEFFLVSGAKMSSSKGVGTSARDMADFLPAEVLRFLMVRTAAKRTVNFSTSFEYIAKLFNDYDKLIQSSMEGKSSEDQQKILAMVQIDEHSTASHPISFQLLVALLQLPHLDLHAEINQRVDVAFTSAKYQGALNKRIASAQYWLQTYATEEERTELQELLPTSVAQLSATQRAFLQLLGEQFPVASCTGDAYQTYIFSIARQTPIAQPKAFAAIYRALFDKDSGPKGGALFSYLARDFLVRRFTDVTFSTDVFWSESSISETECQGWLRKHKSEIVSVDPQCCVNMVESNNPVTGKGVLQLSVLLENGKKHLLRVLVSDFSDVDASAALTAATVLTQALALRLQQDIGFALARESAATLTKEA